MDLWDAVLARQDLVGGDLETNEDGAYFRGPITRLTRTDDQLVIETEWVARLDQNAGWKVYENRPLTVALDMTKPQDIGNGRVFFVLPFLGTCTIFPRGGSKLDPAKVDGLVLPS